MSRLSRKEMKRDEVLEGAARLVHYIQIHGRDLLVGACALVLVALLGAGWLAFVKQGETKANEALARALMLLQAPLDPVDPKPLDANSPSFADEASRSAAARDAFQAVRDEHGNSKVAYVAASYLAELAARAGDAETARQLWQEGSSRARTALDVETLINRLALDRSEGRSAEVLAELETALGDGSSDLPEVLVLDQMAVTLEELGRTEEARAIYQRIMEEFPTSAYARRAGLQLQAL